MIGAHRGGAFAILALALVTVDPAAAQAGSSSIWFVPACEDACGGRAGSLTYRLDASTGAGVVPGASVSTTWRLTGGFVATLDAPTLGRPWLTAARPRLVPLLGGAPLTVHGHELDLGPATTLTIDGRPAAVSARTRDQIQTVMPALTAPGFKDLVVTNDGGTATLVGGLGVLPLLDRPHAVLSGQPFRVSCRGTAGDVIVWLVAAGNGPFAVPVPPFRHALELDPLSMIVLTVSVITDAEGAVHLDLPAVEFLRPLHLQAIAALTAQPGYAPGSFTNVLRL